MKLPETSQLPGVFVVVCMNCCVSIILLRSGLQAPALRIYHSPSAKLRHLRHSHLQERPTQVFQDTNTHNLHHKQTHSKT